MASIQSTAPTQRMAFLRDLSPAAKAALYMLAATVMFAFMNVIVRLCAEALPPTEVAFFRCFFSLLVMLPWIARYGVSSMKTQRLKLYSLRALLAMVSMICWFTAVATIPLAEATALSFTGPLFATAGAALILRETVGWRRWSAVIVGFAGVLIVVQPGAASLSLGASLALASALLAAAGMLMVKSLSRTEPTPAIVAYMMIYLTPLSLIAALPVWQWPPLALLPWLVALGVVGALAHLCFTHALAAADASAVMPYDYLRLPAAAAMAFLAFAEVPTVWTWIGGAVIALSTMYIAQREMALRRARTAPEIPPAS
ncbi:MAG: DMT family transporter [Rhodospirillales bacterium]